MYSLLLTIITCTITYAFTEDITADGDHKCCKAYTNRQDCRSQNDNYSCAWLNKKILEQRDIIRLAGAQCVGTKWAQCKIEDINQDCFTGESDCSDDECVYKDEYDQQRYDTVVVPQESDDSELEADADNYCCKAYLNKKRCLNTRDGYNCYWLSKTDANERLIVQKYGERCLGQKFVACKLNDICDQCFTGGSDGEPSCVYQGNEAIFADINVGQGVKYNWLEDWKLLLGAASVVFVVFAVYFYYKRYNKNDKYALLNDHEYGSTQISN